MTIARVARFAYVACHLDDRRIGVDLKEVERVVRAVEITRLAGLPESVLGVVNYHGNKTPVANIRGYLRLPAREVLTEDRLVLLSTSQGRLAVIVDNVTDVVEASELDILQTDTSDASVMVRTKDGLFYFRSMADVLTAEDHRIVRRVLSA